MLTLVRRTSSFNNNINYFTFYIAFRDNRIVNGAMQGMQAGSFVVMADVVLKWLEMGKRINFQTCCDNCFYSNILL